jgi:hypothetical protein
VANATAKTVSLKGIKKCILDGQAHRVRRGFDPNWRRSMDCCRLNAGRCRSITADAELHGVSAVIAGVETADMLVHEVLSRKLRELKMSKEGLYERPNGLARNPL